jgi:hypothetical protein
MSALKFSEQFMDLLRSTNLLREPRVPLGLLEKYVLPPFDEAFFAVIGFCTFGLPAEPWFFGFFPPASFFMLSPPYATGSRLTREA